MTDEWEEDPESGTTLGPEEALRMEIEKSKTLKVDRLKLRDQIEKLREQNCRLLKENLFLRQKLETEDSFFVSKPTVKGKFLLGIFKDSGLTKLKTRIALMFLLLLLGWFFYFF
tara:strand:+ start:446 stop:787 length:342 start_codon:yes stop_codon:yes gene_type:complete